MNVVVVEITTLINIIASNENVYSGKCGRIILQRNVKCISVIKIVAPIIEIEAVEETEELKQFFMLEMIYLVLEYTMLITKVFT